MSIENIVNINDEREIRLQKLAELSQKGLNCYPAKSFRSNTIREALSMILDSEVTLCGRIMTKREMGKLTFCHLRDESGIIQIALKQESNNIESYKLFVKKIDSGDIIQVTGKRFKTHKGEESVLVSDWKILSKALLPLPDKFHGLQDEEIRFRKRYLDFISNPELKDLFYKKSKFWNNVRNFLVKENFLEVETPVLETTAGGADATPFTTHHNALDIEVFLRISMGELWQKRLMVAGFEKTFEIGRQFRNEGMSREHLQDYTQMEFYWAYADYEMGMALVEKLYKYVAKETFGTLQFEIGDFKVDLNKKWEKIDYQKIIQEKTGIDILSTSLQDIKNKLHELKIKYDKVESKGRLVDSLWKYCRKSISGPAFLVNTPVMVSPLAKRQENNPELTQRFQVIIAGSENGNGYSELNDPIDQSNRFIEQTKMREEGDNEAQMHDFDFVEALEYGMPPTCGFGFSERLFSFLANKPIRECVLFPLMKPESNKDIINIKNIKENKIVVKSKLPLSRDEAFAYLEKNTKKEANLNHYLESEAVMRALAEHLKEDAEYWGMVGLLHDIDWELTENNSKDHLTKAPELLRKLGFETDFIDVILSHGYGFECAGLKDKKRTKKIEHALACSETITGLIYATALMRPTKILDLEVNSVKKKFKDKKFAANVNRDVILECQNLGLSLEEFIEIAIDAMKKIANKIGLN